MKHCSQGSSTCVKNGNTSNYTLNSRTQIQRNFYLGFFIKEKQLARRSMRTPEKYLWWIPIFIASHDNKHKRKGIDEEDNESSNDDK
jgi:hypothetical protein